MLKFPCQGKMPVYEYWCNYCRRIVSSYRQTFSVTPPPCPRCGCSELKQIFSTFSVQKTPSAVYEDILSNRELTQGMLHNDPKALAEWNKRMSGGEKPSAEYEEMTERMEMGEWPIAQIKEKRQEFLGQGESISENG